MANSKKRKVTLKEIEGIAESKTQVLFSDVEEKYAYIDGKRTNTLTSVNVSLISNILGTFPVVFDYREGLRDEIAMKFTFGQAITIADLGHLKNVAISIYQDSLNFKFLVDETIEI